MPTSVTLHGSWFPETPRLLAAFLLVFALGGSGGFVVRAVSLPAAPSSAVSYTHLTLPTILRV